MADIDLARITDMVAIRLNEFPDSRIIPQPGTLATTLSEMVSIFVESEAQRITRESALKEFSEAVDFSSGIRNESKGNGYRSELLLPADFCRLYSLQLSCWPAVLSEESPGNPMRLKIGDAAPDWFRQRMSAPWLQLLVCGGRTLLRYGPATSHETVIANYIPLPRFDTSSSELISFDPALLPRLIDSLATRLITE